LTSGDRDGKRDCEENLGKAKKEKGISEGERWRGGAGADKKNAGIGREVSSYVFVRQKKKHLYRCSTG